MRYLKYLFVGASLFLLGYAHVVALDEALRKDERRALFLKYSRGVAVTWFNITPEKELVEHVLYPMQISFERKFVHIVYEQFDEVGTFELLSYEAGIALWKKNETSIGYGELTDVVME